MFGFYSNLRIFCRFTRLVIEMEILRNCQTNVQTILDIMRRLQGKLTFDGAATVPAVQQQTLTVAQVLHDGQGNKEIRLASSLFGGAFARFWDKMTSAICDPEEGVERGERLAALSFGAQVLALASKFYMLKMGQLEVLDKPKPGMWD